MHALRGSGLALAIGIMLAVWAGLGILKVICETTMNTVWNMPVPARPEFPHVARAGDLIMLAVLGVITFASAAAGGVGAGSDSWPWAIAGAVVSLLLNLVLFLFSVPDADVGAGVVARRPARCRRRRARVDRAPTLGGWYVSHQLRGATQTYGTFATVIGLLAWLYLGAQMTLLAAEVNVVKKRRLWPRAIVQPPLTGADVRALVSYAQEQRRPEEDVTVRIDDRAF